MHCCQQFAAKVADHVEDENLKLDPAVIAIIVAMLPVILEMIKDCVDPEPGPTPPTPEPVPNFSKLADMVRKPSVRQKLALRLTVNNLMRGSGFGWRRDAAQLAAALPKAASSLTDDDLLAMIGELG